MSGIGAGGDGEINSGSVYTLSEFQRRVGLGRVGMQTARRQGLRVIRQHNRAYVRGSDWLDYLESTQGDQSSKS
ncbi:hypothetical protein [Rubinisphaera margarita]|uniref:hypothetical protein n=1 Tax=Rubinisphaera margarita TaxID=2909586 RepID=UPI001EE83AC1|nr:hypothetical protein [Rubinisphaera margarita]MCG6157100.1 hypothetical protein [Rubinisphaera margarita]